MDLYGILKITSMIATGAFGALGLLTKYKDDDGTITKWGRIALGGILLSSVFSLGLYYMETSKAKAAADAAKNEAEATSQVLKNILSNAQITADQQKISLQETNVLKAGLQTTLDQQRLNLERSDYIAKGMENSLTAQRSVLSGNKTILAGVTNTVTKQSELLTLNTSTLNEVSRGLYPIKDVRISYRISVPTDNVQLKSYIDRFNREITALGPTLTMDNRIPWIRGGSSMRNSNAYESFLFSADAPVAPDRTSETLAYTVFAYSDVELQFFKNPINPVKPDLKLELYPQQASQVNIGLNIAGNQTNSVYRRSCFRLILNTGTVRALLSGYQIS